MMMINFNAPLGTAREVGAAFDGIEARSKAAELRTREEDERRRRWLAMAYARIDQGKESEGCDAL